MKKKHRTTSSNKMYDSSVVAEEINHFSNLAEQWWNTDGDFKSLHKINPLRLTYLRNQICQHYRRRETDLNSLNNLSIIDVGCGGGLICEPLARLGAQVSGIDGSKDSIKVANHHAQMMSLDIKYYNQLPEDFALKKAKFDVVISMEVVEHVSDVSIFVEACNKLLKPGGLIISGTLNRSFKSLVLAKYVAEYILNWVPPGTHDWRKFIKPSEFSSYLRASNMRVTDITGIKFDVLRDSWGFSGDLKINYFITAVKSQ